MIQNQKNIPEIKDFKHKSSMSNISLLMANFSPEKTKLLGGSTHWHHLRLK